MSFKPTDATEEDLVCKNKQNELKWKNKQTWDSYRHWPECLLLFSLPTGEDQVADKGPVYQSAVGKGSPMC